MSMMPTRGRSVLLAMTATLFTPLIAAAQSTWHVDSKVTASGDGTSWQRAVKTLCEGISLASSGDTILIAGGASTPSYRPDCASTGDRSLSFTIPDGVSVMGGFAGLNNPSNPGDWNPALYQPVLTGDLDGTAGDAFPSGYSDNSYHVVRFPAHAGPTTSLSYVTIEFGNADCSTCVGGGGIYAVDANPTLKYCTVRHCYGGHGGGIYIHAGLLPVSLDHCVIEWNRAFNGHGGGMFVYCSDLELTDCTIKFNELGASGGRALGGGAYIKATTVLLDSCDVNNNTAGFDVTTWDPTQYGIVDGDGHGLFISAPQTIPITFPPLPPGEIDIRNSQFTDNPDPEDNVLGVGPRASGGALVAAATHIRIDGTTFVRNRSNAGNPSEVPGGGAAHLKSTNEGGTIDIVLCDFEDNESNTNGGSLLVAGGELRIYNSRITRSTAGYGGGMILLDGTSAEIANCEFSNSLAVNFGGGIHITADIPVAIESSTFASCTGAGGALFLGGLPIVTVENCIVWDCRFGGGALNPFFGTSVPTVSYSDVEISSGVYGGTGNINADPLFADAINGDFTLTSSSPCLSAGWSPLLPLDPFDFDGDGTSDTVPYDLNFLTPGATGIVRVRGGSAIVDMGAYEFGTPCSTDWNQNGMVQSDDISAFMTVWLTMSPHADFDLNGTVDSTDLSAFLDAWNAQVIGNCF